MEHLKIQEVQTRKPSGWGARHTLALLGFFAFAISYSMRFNLSLAIVAMVNRTKPLDNQMSSLESQDKVVHPSCLELKSLSNSSASEKEDLNGEFHWSEYDQGIILGSFFWGYAPTQFLGGVLSQKYGGKWPLGLGLFVTAIFTLLTPLAAHTHKYMMICVRVLVGIGEGIAFPAMHSILSSWAPPNERSQIGSTIYAGAQFGTAATMVAGGYIIDGGILGGWPGLFYISGIVSVIWFILWLFLMHETPAKHPKISQQELNYIQKSIGNQRSIIIGKPPWKKFFTSMPLYAIIVANFGHAWGLYMLLTGMPTYFKTVLNFDIKQNSWLSAFPHLVMWLMALFLTRMADLLISKKVLSTTIVRKMFESIAHLGSATALILVAITGCNSTFTIILLTIAVGINGSVYAGYYINHLDIAANHAGVLLGISNTIGNLSGFLAPALTGFIINKDPSLENWQIVFYVTAGIYVCEATFFSIFASGKEQHWNRSNILPKS